MNDIQLYEPAPEPRDVVVFEPAVRGGSDADIVDLAALVAAFRRRFWLFVSVAGGLFALTLLVTVMTTPTYRATARVAINTQAVQVAPSSVSGTENAPVVSALPDVSSAIDTEVAVIGSRRVAERVVSNLHLEQDPEFGGTQAGQKLGHIGQIKRAIGDFFSRLSPARSAPVTPIAADDSTVTAVLSRLTALRFNLTDAIDISFEDADPQKAAQIANAFAQAYVDDQIVTKLEASRQANAFLQTRIDQMRQQYAGDTQKLEQYKIAHNLLTAGASTLTEQEISTYNQSVAQAKADAAADQASLNTARQQLAHGSNGEDVGEALSSGVIGSLRAQRAALSEHVADLQGRYGDKYPELLVAKRQLADIDQQIQAEINRVISNLEAKVDVSQQRLQSLEGSLAATKGTLAGNNEAEVGLNQLQQDADASQALYQSYLNRLKETAAQEGGEQSDARILSPAPQPTTPSSPVVWLNLLLGVVLGAGAGLAAVFLAEMFDSGLTTAEDIERRLGQRYLGGIPLLSSVDPGTRSSPVDAVVRQPQSAYAEAFRNLRASINYVFSGTHPRVVCISSALPQEGKTTVAIGLARSAASQGIRTVLVDCDFRRRGVNRVMNGASDRPGVIDVLSGGATLAESLVVDELSGAYLLPVNKTKIPPEDLISGQAMADLLAELRGQFELVVIDSPPLLPIADARIIATMADAVVLIARWRKTSAPVVRAALRLLPANQTRLAGIAITQIDMRKQSKYGYGDPGFYYHRYKEYYG